jgi:hypothetical protein
MKFTVGPCGRSCAGLANSAWRAILAAVAVLVAAPEVAVTEATVATISGQARPAGNARSAGRTTSVWHVQIADVVGLIFEVDRAPAAARAGTSTVTCATAVTAAPAVGRIFAAAPIATSSAISTVAAIAAVSTIAAASARRVELNASFEGRHSEHKNLTLRAGGSVQTVGALCPWDAVLAGRGTGVPKKVTLCALSVLTATAVISFAPIAAVLACRAREIKNASCWHGASCLLVVGHELRVERGVIDLEYIGEPVDQVDRVALHAARDVQAQK